LDSFGKTTGKKTLMQVIKYYWENGNNPPLFLGDWLKSLSWTR
jgi:hypothetical protein